MTLISLPVINQYYERIVINHNWKKRKAASVETCGYLQRHTNDANGKNEDFDC